MGKCRGSEGFNLVEAAIVLGVVGLVIGGIWVAASGVQRNMYRSEVKSVLQRGDQNFQAVWKNIPFVNDGSNFVLITPTIFPPAEVVNASTLGAPYTNYDFGSALVYRSPGGVVYELYADLTGGTTRMTATIGPLDRADCNWFGRSFSTIVPHGQTGQTWGQVYVTTSSGTTTELNYDWDGLFNIGDPMVAYLNNGCEAGRVNFITVRYPQN